MAGTNAHQASRRETQPSQMVSSLPTKWEMQQYQFRNVFTTKKTGYHHWSPKHSCGVALPFELDSNVEVDIWIRRLCAELILNGIRPQTANKRMCAFPPERKSMTGRRTVEWVALAAPGARVLAAVT